MKKTLVAASAGLALIASQAAAAGAVAAPRVQDRLGETGAPAGAQLAGLPFALAFVLGFTAIAVASEDDSESD